MFRSLQALALCSTLLVACGGGSSVPTLPAVVSITPTNGAKGVTADAKIVVTFSKPMDQAATQSAYESGDLPASGVTFTWNADSTVMTITPKAALAYAQGTTFTQPAKTYAFSISGVATDKAGNRLGLTNSAFSTLRDITAILPTVPALVAEYSHDGNAYGVAIVSPIRVGDSAANEGLRGYLTFDLSAIPTDVGAAPLSATLHLTKDYTQGSPYLNLNNCVPTPTTVCASPYVSLKLDHVAFGSELFNGLYTVYNTPVLHALGAIATFQSGDDLTASALVAVQDDLANRVARGNRSEYRLSFPLETNNDNSPDVVAVYAAANTLHSPFLTVAYRIP